MPRLNHYLSEPSALSGSWCYMWWSSWGMEFLQRRGQRGWWLGATGTSTPEGKDPIRKKAMALHLSQAHTYAPQRNTVFKKYLPVLPHFPRTLSRHWHRISARTKQHPQCLSVMVFPAFWWDLARGWMQWEASAAAGPLLVCVFLFPAPTSVFQLHRFCLSSWQTDFFKFNKGQCIFLL